MAGYNAGRTICLQTGSSSAGLRWLEDPDDGTNVAYVAGYEWAIWDYDDANGLQTRLPRNREAN